MITTDEFGSDIYWDIKNLGGDVLVGVGKNTYSSKETYTETLCLPQSGPFELTIWDN